MFICIFSTFSKSISLRSINPKTLNRRTLGRRRAEPLLNIKVKTNICPTNIYIYDKILVFQNISVKLFHNFVYFIFQQYLIDFWVWIYSIYLAKFITPFEIQFDAIINVVYFLSFLLICLYIFNIRNITTYLY